jgi:hypothetical protein
MLTVLGAVVVGLLLEIAKLVVVALIAIWLARRFGWIR